MSDAVQVCDLCGLAARCFPVERTAGEKPLWFCCRGCQMVYSLLSEAAGSADPKAFRETALFRQCQAAGVIPRSEEDIRAPGAVPPLEPPPPPGHQLEWQCRIGGMWCPACAWVIETAASRQAGVYQAACSFATDRFRCTYDPVITSPPQILRALEGLGYPIQPSDADTPDPERKREWIRFGISAFLTLNVMMLSFALYGGFFTHLDAWDIKMIGWPVMGMATLVMAYGGRPIFQKARHGLAAGSSGMETLIAMGASSAYGFSVYHFLGGSFQVYFDTASMLITLVLLGKLIEGGVRKDVQSHLDAFLSLMPQKVKRCSPEFPMGRYEAAEGLRVGEVFILEDGEVAVADGIVSRGQGRIDTSSLTGEPLPISVRSGDTVLSGSRMLTGRIEITASAVGSDATLGQMIRLMESALIRKIPLETRADRILKWFVPGIAATAVLTALGCHMGGMPPAACLIRGITVLVISCPCALGIAIPLARVAGISTAARQGLLVRDFAAFEEAERVTTVVFDKTGTLTAGNWSLQEIRCIGSRSEDELLAWAAAIENRCRHGIAAEIRNRAMERRLDIPDAEEILESEQGAEGTIPGHLVRIGSPHWIGRQSKGFEECGEENRRFYGSRVFMSIDREPAAIFVFGDPIRPSARRTMQTLRQMGKKVIMLSGDEAEAVQSVADSLGIQNYRGGMTPQEKAACIRELSRKGERIAMAGDGINDAPAMAEAHLAIAVHSGQPLGQESAGIVLMRGDPLQILDVLNLAGRVNRIITQNLYWAMIYNLIGIPAAVFGLLNPLIAVTAMLLSSLSVVGNTLRLTRIKKSDHASHFQTESEGRIPS